MGILVMALWLKSTSWMRGAVPTSSPGSKNLKKTILKFLPYNNCFKPAVLQFYSCRLKLTLNFLRRLPLFQTTIKTYSIKVVFRSQKGIIIQVLIQPPSCVEQKSSEAVQLKKILALRFHVVYIFIQRWKIS